MKNYRTPSKLWKLDHHEEIKSVDENLKKKKRGLEIENNSNIKRTSGG